MSPSTGPVTTDTGNNPHLKRAYAISNPAEAAAVYDEWAASFDSDMESSAIDYQAPTIIAQLVLAHLGSRSGSKIEENIEILDAGCGSGLAGVKLAELGTRIIDGVDVSEGMLKIARNTGVYRMLEAADLTQPMQMKDDTYDVVVCVGTLTHGHVGPEAISEFVRVTKDKGLVAATVLGDIWESHGYKDEVARLEHAGKVQVLNTSMEDYRRGGGVKAVMLVLRVTK